MQKETVIVSVGGSLIAPKEIDVGFLKKLKEVVLKHISKKRFFIYVGGGKTARIYQNAFREFGGSSRELDWIGIHATRMNVRVMKRVLKEVAHPEIVFDPTKRINIKKDVLVLGGWKPGWSTDYDTVLLAKTYGIKKIVNLTNIDYVYDKDPKKFKDARAIEEMDWEEFEKIVGEEWSPGLSAPFDPVAAKLAKEIKAEVAIINGAKIERLDSFLGGGKFKGTIIK